MKNICLILILVFLQFNCFAQETKLENLIPVTTALKVNFNGLKIGIEQKMYKNITAQFEIGKFIEGKSITFKPQIRVYRKVFKKDFTYLGLAYFYKHQETAYNDTLRQLDNNGNFTGSRYTKDFTVSKYIHAITLNTGFISDATLFKTRFIFEFNIGVGIRYKKSSRYGISENEDFDLQEAMFIRPQNYQETNGAFKMYPELNATVSLVIPLII
jgi:hypothetical protein